ncbi:hypothetical protein [Clostridium estertheticum]|uniref:hypothetical protein n=1 Tax=Clostridium estertheticum TaxID=238834 RepID=UPI001C6F2ADC|nr:hypothetical protein [Clostridium estertheticum]MBW9153040.1 hypothetical protein [Clostridium estertheticum]WLC82599.1 hypothetical protein KTC97_10595 [Clostridium estertheticum]
MKINKKVIANLTKCYSVAPLKYKGTNCFLVAAEKVDRCILFDLEGNEIETVWNEPGGVMSMVQVPGTNGQFLATHKFYSPNDSKQAKIVIVTPGTDGRWSVKTLVNLPHVHRFDLIKRNGNIYLIACTLKSGHEYKDDWSSPGKVYAAKLPNDLSKFNEEFQLELKLIKDGMLKNHGYYKVMEEGVETAVISSEIGVFQFVPPEVEGVEWEIKQLINTPSSDAVLVDIDSDGEMELAVLAPFHGETVRIYKKIEGTYTEMYAHHEPVEFTHALYGGNLCGKPSIVVGHRQGEKSLFALTYNIEKGKIQCENIDTGCGPANVYHYVKDHKDIIIATNREIDEVAMYTIEP